jgi:hypothetical protein
MFPKVGLNVPWQVPAAPLSRFVVKSNAAEKLPIDGFTVLEFQPSGVAVVSNGPTQPPDLVIPSNFATWTVT